MARFSSSLAGSTSLSSGIVSFNNVLTAVAQSFAWTVPAGVTQIAVTGCAPGGSSFQTTNPGTNDNASCSVFANGHIYGTDNGTTDNQGYFLDPHTMRLGNFGTSTAQGFTRSAQSGRLLLVSPLGQNMLFFHTGTTVILRSTDGGRNWTSISYSQSAHQSCGAFHSSDENLVVTGSAGSNFAHYSINGGLTWAAVPNLPAGFACQNVKFVNGNFVILATATGNSRLGFSPDAVNWTWVDLGFTAPPVDIAFGAGVFALAVRNTTNNLYTATALNGTWTSRTFGSAANVNCITFANGCFIAAGDAGITQRRSTDGITWSSTTGGSLSGVVGCRNIAWSPVGINANGTWCVGRSGAGVNISTDNGVTWTNVGSADYNANTNGVTWQGGIFGTLFGIIAITTTGTAVKYVGTTAINPISQRLSMDAVIARISAGIVQEVLRLEGGQSSMWDTSTTYTSGDGGSFVGTKFRGTGNGTSTGPGNGEGGLGARFNATSGIPIRHQNSAGGMAIGTNSFGGGAARQLPDIINLTGGRPNTLRFPGASGGNSGTNSASGGGSSIFGFGGDAHSETNDAVNVAAPGWGGGASGRHNQGTAGAGGGEGVYRYSLTVTPGDTLYFHNHHSIGRANNNNQGFVGNPGAWIIEWNAA